MTMTMTMTNELTQMLPALRRFAYSLTGSVHDADDLVQNCLMRLLQSPPPADVPLVKWAFRVCRNLWIDDYRARKVQRLGAERHKNESQTCKDGEAEMLDELSIREVGRAMDSLSTEQREVLSLVAVQGMSYQEAADVLAIPSGTIMSRLARARANIVDYFSAHKMERPL
jgi:RNA polymerase sigma factor (sigma-70 family)